MRAEQQQAKSDSQNVHQKSKMSPLHEMQLRAFLSAVDDVDADSVTLDDLLDGVDDEVCSSMMGHDSTSESSDTDDLSSISDNDVFTGTVCGEPVDAGQLRALEQEGTRRLVLLHAYLQCWTKLADKIKVLSVEQAWSKEEIRRMIHFLKEHGESHWSCMPATLELTLSSGMSAFDKEYVVAQQIPIVKLLFALRISHFDVLVVRDCSFIMLIYFTRRLLQRTPCC